MTHHYQSPMVFIVYAAILAVALVAQPSQGYADDFLEAKTSFNAYRDRAFKLQNQPQNKYLVGEFTSLTQWTDRAERLLREEEEDDFVRVVHLIRVQLRLIEVSFTEIDAREQLLRLNDEMTRLEGKAKQEREAVVELERQMGGSLTATPQAAPVRAVQRTAPQQVPVAVPPSSPRLAPPQVQPQVPARGGR